MPGDASAYAALGLEPGADPAAVDRAYRRLIKQYHPDREGGDATRAAEINRAYRELRTAREEEGELFVDSCDVVHPQPPGRPTSSRAAVFAAISVAALVLLSGPASRAIGTLSASPDSTGPAAHAAASGAGEPMDQPLALGAINGAIYEAVRMDRNQDEMALAAASRDCHHQLRLKPSLARLDRCAAFDDAVVELQDRDPLRDQGPFSELAVTGRQMSAGTLFSDDYLAIDGRLGRIRLHVELALAQAVTPVSDVSGAAND
jgi:hypothetical protein